MSEEAEQVKALANEFASLVRARCVAVAGEGAAGESEPERAWEAVFGTHRIEADSMEELTRKVSTMLFDRMNIAAGMVIMLAMQVAEAEGLSVVEVIDRVEQVIVNGADELG